MTKAKQMPRIISLIIIVTLFTTFSIVGQTKSLVLNTTGQPPLNTKDKTGFLDRVAIEAFSRIGFEITTIRLPAERGLINVNTGVDDGEMFRVSGLQKIYPNIVPVPEKMIDIDFVVFSKLDITLDKGWDSLKPYSVAIVNGWKILEQNIPKSAEVISVNHPLQLFDMLNKGRAQLIVYERFSGQGIIKQSQFNDIKLIEPPLASREMFMYLNKKHRSIIPKLADALRNMKNDGTYQKIMRQTLQ